MTAGEGRQAADLIALTTTIMHAVIARGGRSDPAEDTALHDAVTEASCPVVEMALCGLAGQYLAAIDTLAQVTGIDAEKLVTATLSLPVRDQ